MRLLREEPSSWQRLRQRRGTGSNSDGGARRAPGNWQARARTARPGAALEGCGSAALSALGAAALIETKLSSARLREEITRLEKRIVRHAELIDSAFQSTRASQSDPVPIEDAQQLLHENEARSILDRQLWQLCLGHHEKRVRWVKLAAGRREIVSRSTLYVAVWMAGAGTTTEDRGARDCSKPSYTSSDYERGAPLPSTWPRHELYRDLFSGIEDLIQISIFW